MFEKLKEKRAEKKRLKQQKKIRDVLTMLQWFFAMFCFLSLIVYGFHIGSILMVFLGIAALPVEPIRNVWRMVLKDKATPKIKVIIIAVLFFIACCTLPELPESDTTEPNDTQIVLDTENSETESEIETEVTTESETALETENTSESEGISETESVVDDTPSQLPTEPSVSMNNIPAYSGNDYVVLNDNVPNFSTDDLNSVSYEYYSDLDSLGRCGVVYACIGQDIMPTEERGSIGHIKPSGWHTIKYNGVVDGNYLYNRCHLIGYQLTGENDNVKNLITGTRQMNVEGMLPFENMVADYVKETNNHVMYRVTPIFDGNNLLASGVQMEGYSVEDSGAGICFNVFVYNVQDGIEIDYATGDSSLIETEEPESETPVVVPTPEPEPEPEQPSPSGAFAVNSKNGKIHMVGACSATGSGDNAMTDPVYFNTYDEALIYSQQVAPNQSKRECGNCW